MQNTLFTNLEKKYKIILPKTLLVCMKVPYSKRKKMFGQYVISFFFNIHEKNFLTNSRFLPDQCTDVVS